jgi:hypothetical protein
MSGLKIPTIDTIVEANAYEARMHFLYPDEYTFSRYVIVPGQVSEPTAEAAQVELSYGNRPGVLMWVDFSKPEVIRDRNEGRGERYTTRSHRVGEIAVASSLDALYPYREVEVTSFIRLWMARYALDRSRDTQGRSRRPLDDIYELHQRTRIGQEFTALQHRAHQEQWDERIDLKQWYSSYLARAAQLDYPDLFTNDPDSWHRRMHFALTHSPVSDRRTESISMVPNVRQHGYRSPDARRVGINVENEGDKWALLSSIRTNTDNATVIWKFDGIQSIDHASDDPLTFVCFVDPTEDEAVVQKYLIQELEDIRASRLHGETRIHRRPEWHRERMRELGRSSIVRVYEGKMWTIEAWQAVSSRQLEAVRVIEPYIPPEPAPIVYDTVRPVGYQTEDAQMIAMVFEEPNHKTRFLASILRPAPPFHPDTSKKWAAWDILGLQSVDTTKDDMMSLRFFVDAGRDEQHIIEAMVINQIATMIADGLAAKIPLEKIVLETVPYVRRQPQLFSQLKRVQKRVKAIMVRDHKITAHNAGVNVDELHTTLSEVINGTHK